MLARLSPYYSAAWRSAVVLLSIEIAVVSMLKYFSDAVPAPEPILANRFADPYLVIHVVSGAIALLVGPIQFAARIRERRPALHRMSGRLYVAASAVAAPTGLLLAIGSVLGTVAAVGFAIPAILLPLFTWLGLRAVLARRIEEHREWMLRSYALMANAITFRLLLPGAAFVGVDFMTIYPIAAWLGWIINLALAEYVIRRKRVVAANFETLATA